MINNISRSSNIDGYANRNKNEKNKQNNKKKNKVKQSDFDKVLFEKYKELD